MRHRRLYSDQELTHAVESSRSWRGVLRTLGLTATSGAAIRSVRMRADRLGLDYTHFTGQRRWTDQRLADAIASARSWVQVADTLGLAGGSSTATLKGHAVRLGIDISHLSGAPALPGVREQLRPRPENLARAGSLLAAAWFELCGHQVSWPLEPCRYDLLAWMDSKPERIQVKTTRSRTGQSWTVWISNSRNGPRRVYDPDEVDRFFIVDGDLAYYLIPVQVVGGLSAVRLDAYQRFRLPQM